MLHKFNGKVNINYLILNKIHLDNWLNIYDQIKLKDLHK